MSESPAVQAIDEAFARLEALEARYREQFGPIPSPAERLIAMRGVKLCAWCQDRHFRPYPEQAASSCNVIQCQCWCTQGTGQ